MTPAEERILLKRVRDLELAVVEQLRQERAPLGYRWDKWLAPARRRIVARLRRAGEDV